jgi:hypothetical protein
MITERSLWPSGNSAPWASGKRIGFGAAYPMARTFACLRIAEAISDPVARLATGSGGLTLSRTGFAPAGRLTKFHEGLVSSLPFDQHCLVALNFLYSLALFLDLTIGIIACIEAVLAIAPVVTFRKGVFCISPHRGIFQQDTLLTTTKASG